MWLIYSFQCDSSIPTAHLGQRRGVFDDGSLQARNRIVSESLMHITPPSFEAGCGGIDLYAGSFSLTPTVVSVTDLVGFVQYTSRILLGDPERTGAVGLVEKFRWGNVAFTDQEKAFMERAPHGLGAMSHNLGQRDTGMARDFTEHAAPVIALEMTKLLLDDLIGQATQAVSFQQNPYAKQVIEQIRTAKQDVAQQYSEIAQRYGNLQTLMTHYSSLAQFVKGQPLTSDTAPADTDAMQ